MIINPLADLLASGECQVLPPIKTGTQKYRGPGKRLPKHLIGYRRSLRRSFAIAQGKYVRLF